MNNIKRVRDSMNELNQEPLNFKKVTKENTPMNVDVFARAAMEGRNFPKKEEFLITDALVNFLRVDDNSQIPIENLGQYFPKYTSDNPKEELEYQKMKLQKMDTLSDYLQSYQQSLGELQEEYDSLIAKTQEKTGTLVKTPSFQEQVDVLTNEIHMSEIHISDVTGEYKQKTLDVNDLGITYEEFMALSFDEQKDLVSKKSSYCQESVEIIENAKKELDEATREMMGFDTYQAYLGKRDYLQSEITLFTIAIQNTKEQMKLLPYNMLLERSDFQEFCQKTYELQSIEKYMDGVEGTTVVDYTSYCRDNGYIPPAKFCSMLNSNFSVLGVSVTPLFQMLVEVGDPVMISTYDYLYQTKGKDAADEYLSTIENTLHQMKAEQNVNAFYDSLDKTDDGQVSDSIKNYFAIYGQGFGDGVQDYIENLFSWFQKDGVKSINEWEQIYLLQKLQETDDVLGEVYKVGVWSGKTASEVTVALITSQLTGGAYIRNIMSLASSTGNTFHSNMSKDGDVALSLFYTVLSTCTDQMASKMIGSLAGDVDVIFDIDDLVPDSAVQKMYKLIRNRAKKEGNRFLKKAFRKSEDKVFYGSDTDWLEIPGSAVEDCLADLCLKGLISSDGSVEITYEGQQHTITIQEVVQYIEKNSDNMLSQDAFGKFFFDKII